MEGVRHAIDRRLLSGVYFCILLSTFVYHRKEGLIMPRKVIADLGNRLWKMKIGGIEISIPHAMVEITQAEYNKELKVANNHLSEDYVIVNDRYFVVGESAENHGLIQSVTGASKYHPDYYG